MRGFTKDLSRWKEYDYVVINDDLLKCYKMIMRVIKNNNNIKFDKKKIYNHVKKLLN